MDGYSSKSNGHDDQVCLLNALQGTEEDVRGFLWARRSDDSCHYDDGKVTPTVLGKLVVVIRKGQD